MTRRDMSVTDAVPAGKTPMLNVVAKDLQEKYRGTFGIETVQELVFDSYTRLAATATVDQWLVLGTEKFTDERLQAMVHAEDHSPKRLPGVLFLCVHNAGRSQMALGWFRQLAGDRAVAWSGGSHPESDVNDDVVAAMAEVSVDISQAFPKPWTDEFFGAADVVITMGCGDACPLIPGKHYEDWELEDPAGKTLDEIRQIRDEIKRRVIRLMAQLEIPIA